MPIVIDNKENCVGCGACVAGCPVNCINLQTDNEGFLYPYINNEICVNCQLCIKVCPMQNGDRNKTNPTQAWAMQNKNDNVRNDSSSGGVFSLLAETVLEENGLVFGAAFDERHHIKHICIDAVEQLYMLRGSKYVQSELCEVYNKIKEFLKNEKKVLFIGTPCQVAAILNFVGEEQTNLYTLDIACFGVPSSLVWDKFIKYRSKKAKSNIKRVNFRYKNPSWERYAIKLEFENGKEYVCDHGEDPYMKCFIRKLTLRPSCYNCKFKEYKSGADLTLGDLWGVAKLAEAMNDKKGTSLVIAHSKKGLELLSKISPNALITTINLKEAEGFNSALVVSPQKPVVRERFLFGLTEHNFDSRVKKFCSPSIIKRIYNKACRILKK